MTVEFDGIKVDVNNVIAQKKIKAYIMKATNQVRTRKLWTPEQRTKALAMHHGGATLEAISQALGRSPASVYVYLWKEGAFKKVEKVEKVKQFVI